jgi:hypothetical protein
VTATIDETRTAVGFNLRFADFEAAQRLAASGPAILVDRVAAKSNLALYIRAKEESERNGKPIQFVDPPSEPLPPAYEVPRSECRTLAGYEAAKAEADRLGLPLRMTGNSGDSA